MFYHFCQTAKTVLPQPVRANLRERLQPAMKQWRRSPLAKYLVHQRADVYLISFPRSGRTWLRTMMGTALCDYFDLERASPELIAELWKQDARIPSICLDHSAIRLNDPDKFRQKKVVLLVRDPLDIGVSMYHFKQRQGELKGHVLQVVKQVVESYNAWANYIQDHPACLLIKYEDLLATPQEVLTQIFNFIELPQVCEGEVLQQTVETCSFENMKKLADDPQRSLFYRPNNSVMVRSGQAGSSKAELSQATYEELKQFVTQALSQDFNYSYSLNL
ncbi:MAG: sulfotransferase domain-containing protein [Leptolyngbyaceae cyanobacterium]